MHGDALVAVAVGDEHFVRLRIDVNLGDQVEAILREAVGAEPVLLDAEHVQELAVLRELQDHAVAALPLPPIQTLPLWSTQMPWFDAGH